MFVKFSRFTIKIFLFVTLLTLVIISSILFARSSGATTSNVAIGPC